MPLYCPCAKPGSKASISINVLLKLKRTLWTSSDHIPWLARHMADEYGFGGVALSKDESAVAEANCSVPGLHIYWDFKNDPAWAATFVDGPQRGLLSICGWQLSPRTKWAAMNAISEYPVTYEEAGTAELKQAAYDFIVNHCRTIAEAQQPPPPTA